jgi:hypothetical protein
MHTYDEHLVLTLKSGVTLTLLEEFKIGNANNTMHVTKGFFESIIGLLLDIIGKMKHGLNARKDLQALGIRKELHPQEYNASGVTVVATVYLQYLCIVPTLFVTVDMYFKFDSISNLTLFGFSFQSYLRLVKKLPLFEYK